MESLKLMELSKKEMRNVQGAKWITDVQWLTGTHTQAWGDGSQGATTYLDGMYAGHDNPEGSLGGDWWRWTGRVIDTRPPIIKII